MDITEQTGFLHGSFDGARLTDNFDTFMSEEKHVTSVTSRMTVGLSFKGDRIIIIELGNGKVDDMRNMLGNIDPDGRSGAPCKVAC